MKEKKCFVAYPSYPPALGETIEEFINIINAGKTVNAESWKRTKIGGKFIITAICNAIDDCEIFICDLTFLNKNVLFELGYAISKNKRVWIIRDKNISDANVDFKTFELLTTIGYIPYSNSRDLVSSFYEEAPDSDLDGTIFKDCLNSITQKKKQPTLLYLKSMVDTDASVNLSNVISKSTINKVIDDPYEVRIQTLQWYIQQVNYAFVFIGHLLGDNHQNSIFHNAKVSLVAGLALGFEKNILLLAHEPYESPIDYKDLLKRHSTATGCRDYASYWLEPIEKDYDKLRLRDFEYSRKLKESTTLQGIDVGDITAEHESDEIIDYFIETGAYLDALQSESTILIGRKGTGKTAILYKLANEFSMDRRNHVCVIKPIAYELEGMIQMLTQTLEISERGFLVESLWKYLIYTELAKGLAEEIEEKSMYNEVKKEESSLLEYVKYNSDVIMPEFSIRLDNVVEKLKSLSPEKSLGGNRIKISERLHSAIISKLRILLGDLLCDKHKVVILIDNLDKAWRRREDSNILCDLLVGILEIIQTIVNEFKKSSGKKKAVNINMTLFIRSDIFLRLYQTASERDKLDYKRILWDDKEMLLRIIEERIMKSHVAPSTPLQIWEKYFCSHVESAPIKDFVLENILPRPRDIIYFMREAITSAKNCKHSIVEEKDMLYARKRYSQYAIDTVIAESRFEEIEEYLFEFIGNNEITTEKEITTRFINFDKRLLKAVIENLCDLTFLAREIDENRFEFQYIDEMKPKYQSMARRVKETTKVERYKINKAFHDYLEIIPTT